MRVLRALLALAGVVLVALAATPWIDRIDPTWLPAVQALGRVWIALAALGLVLSLLARAWWSTAAHAVAIAVALVTIVNVSNRPACDPGADGLSVLTLNAHRGDAEVDDLARLIERWDVDVLVLTEATEPLIAALSETEAGTRFVARTAQTVEEREASGTVILSRLPAERVRVPASEVRTFQQPAMAVAAGDSTVLVRAVHPRPPVAPTVRDWREGLLELGRWQREHRGRPLVMAGDFNASAAHAPFRDAKRGMYDAAGWWPTATWPLDRAYPAFTDIDHVLVRGLRVEDSATEEVDGTDHRAVWADLRVCRR